MLSFFRQLRLDLGIKELLPEWKLLFTTQYLKNDLSAGITVGLVAIPLSLAIALASGVSPGAGLISAIVAGIVCALFGGSRLSVSGPAAAMAVLIADTVEKIGVQGLIFVGLIAGILQLACGVLGFGRLARYVPIPVIAGFTAGIGVIIFIGQLPRAFGLMPPAESHTIDVLLHVKQYFHQVSWVCVGLTMFTFLVIRLLPYVFTKVPSILVAVIATTVIVWFFQINVPVIGDIPRTLPLPTLPAQIPYSTDLLVIIFSIFLLASLETLLSTTAIDKLTSAKKHNPNQELIGQGLGNILVSLFGGIPVTAVIVRSATNIRAGAKTFRSSLIHSFLILLTVFVIAPWIQIIPVVALAGVLFSIALSMINYHEFKNFWKTDSGEGLIYLVTFLTIISVDLIAGVQAGIIAAAVIVLFKAAKTSLHFTTSTEDGVTRLSVMGSLTFLSASEVADLENKLNAVKPNQVVVLDLLNLSSLDSSGAGAIIDLYQHCVSSNIRFYIKGLSRRFEKLFLINGGKEILDKCYIVTENELKKQALSDKFKSSRERLIHGLHLFYNDREANDSRLFEFMVSQQDPHTLFITCSDSRMVPNLLTSTEPGELFIVRNVGNYIPPYQALEVFSEAAALEFALSNLTISDIVICGHTNCGAIKACHRSDTDLPPKLQSWISMIKSQLTVDSNIDVNELAKMNVLNQLKNLKNYPLVQQRFHSGPELNIHAWFFDFEKNLVYEWNDKENAFQPIEKEITEAE